MKELLNNPKNIKKAVNAFIIIGGAIAAIIAFTPEEILPSTYKIFILNSGGVLAGALKGIEKLFIEP